MRFCVYGASSDRLDREYFDAAEKLGRLMAEQGHGLVFGGGQGGLMGAVARGCSAGGGEIIGIAPRFFDRPGILYPDCTEFIYTEDMRQRKAKMEELAEGFIVLPGGIGTYEEFFEMLTLKQLGRHGKPMAMLNTRGFYTPMLKLLEYTAEEGFMSRNCLELFMLIEEPEALLEYITTAETFAGDLDRLENYNK